MLKGRPECGTSFEQATAREGTQMISNEGIARPAAEFDARWNAWIARGRVHERLVRRKFVLWAGVFATAAAVAYAFLRR